MKSKVLYVCLLLVCSTISWAQVKHNFKMEPAKTDCHELPDSLKLLPKDSTLALLKHTAFRYRQDVSISRYRSPRAASFYSCDGSKGFIIVHENDSTFQIFKDVPKAVWDSFTSSTDPFSFYKSSALKKYLIKN